MDKWKIGKKKTKGGDGVACVRGEEREKGEKKVFSYL